MSAHNEITNLIYSYAELMDAGDFEAIADMFEHTVITVEGVDSVVEGRDAVFHAYSSSSQTYDDNTPKTKHVITNVIVDVDESAGTATSRSYFTVLQAVPNRLPLQPILAGRYRESFEHVDGAWRKATMHIIWDLVGDLSAHMKVELG
jgi:3-phenylpropionate/cinnamic acid dioxygenase small subunit